MGNRLLIILMKEFLNKDNKNSLTADIWSQLLTVTNSFQIHGHDIKN